MGSSASCTLSFTVRASGVEGSVVREEVGAYGKRQTLQLRSSTGRDSVRRVSSLESQSSRSQLSDIFWVEAYDFDARFLR